MDLALGWSGEAVGAVNGGWTRGRRGRSGRRHVGVVECHLEFGTNVNLLRDLIHVEVGGSRCSITAVRVTVHATAVVDPRGGPGVRGGVKGNNRRGET